MHRRLLGPGLEAEWVEGVESLGVKFPRYESKYQAYKGLAMLDRLSSSIHVPARCFTELGPMQHLRTNETQMSRAPTRCRWRSIEHSPWSQPRVQHCRATPAAESASNTVTIGCQPCMDGTTTMEIDEAKVITKFIAETLLPTRHGVFRLRGYKHSVDGGLTFTEPTAIMCGAVENCENVPVRVHDACYTSEVLGSLKCDCAEQLTLAMEMIHSNPPGIVIYLQQEGRGIGLANKIAAYSLQESGLDTVDANRALGLPDDCREYTSVRNILAGLGVKSIQLITNNPRKINGLRALGLNITGRVPCIVQAANEHNVGYLQAKESRMDHLLEGQFCYWNHGGEPTLPIATTLAKGGMGLPKNLKINGAGRVSLDEGDQDGVPLEGSSGSSSSSNGSHVEEASAASSAVTAASDAREPV
ncbi:hypothetical protein QJQ45_025867 [Haematococcus lacustris]|nr:hypothetical protein QJQ45_025867 [Haematococcus lacustris]